MTDTNPPADRTAEIRARLAAISPTMSVRVADGDSTLIATTERSERLGEFTNGVVGLVESLGDVKVRQTGVTIADDDEGQDLTFLLHAPADIAYLLAELDKAHRRNELLTSAKNHATEARDKYARRVVEWREAAEKAAAERDAYKRAKEENDDRFLMERNEARVRVEELEGQAEKVRAFIDERAQFIQLLRNYRGEDNGDYIRWTGNAEARRVLAGVMGIELDKETGGIRKSVEEPPTAPDAKRTGELIGPDTLCPCGKVNDGTGSGYCSGEHFDKYDGWNL